MAQLYAQVILPLSLHDAYTYKVPQSLQDIIAPGKRVIVQFGSRKLYAALVSSVSANKTENLFEIKEIGEVLDEHPVVLPNNLALWQWIAQYYCCTLGDVFRAALPTGLKLESKSRIFLTGSEDGSFSYAVKVIHYPSGKEFICDEFKSQLDNEIRNTK